MVTIALFLGFYVLSKGNPQPQVLTSVNKIKPLTPLPGSHYSYDLRSLAKTSDELGVANAVYQYCLTKIDWHDPKVTKDSVYAASATNTGDTFDLKTIQYVQRDKNVNMIASCYTSAEANDPANPYLPGPNKAYGAIVTSFYLHKANKHWVVDDTEQNGYPACSYEYKGHIYKDCKFRVTP